MLANSLFVIGALALYNSAQCFIPKLNVTKRIYSKDPTQLTALTSRMMGTWTMTSAMIRLYASYHIHEKAAYDLTIGTFVLALMSFGSEVFVFKTAPITSPGVFPVFIITGIKKLISNSFDLDVYPIRLLCNS